MVACMWTSKVFDGPVRVLSNASQERPILADMKHHYSAVQPYPMYALVVHLREGPHQ